METKFKPTLEGLNEFSAAHYKRLHMVAADLEMDVDAQLKDDDFEYFYEYYLNSGEMPYGTAKARDGDPYEWVTERIMKDAA